MSSSELAVIVWAVTAAVGVLFSGTMISSRWRSLRYHYRSKGNGDRAYRMFLARQDIRRSVVRHMAFGSGFAVGALFLILEYTDWIAQPPRWLLDHWVWLLALLMFLSTVNEVWDRWALHRVRSWPDHHAESDGNEAQP